MKQFELSAENGTLLLVNREKMDPLVEKLRLVIAIELGTDQEHAAYVLGFLHDENLEGQEITPEDIPFFRDLISIGVLGMPEDESDLGKVLHTGTPEEEDTDLGKAMHEGSGNQQDRFVRCTVCKATYTDAESIKMVDDWLTSKSGYAPCPNIGCKGTLAISGTC